MAEEWQGSRPRKFYGGLQIVRAAYKREMDIFASTTEFKSKGLENVKSKRHFVEKQSGVLPDWRPCLRMSRTNSQKIKTLKITELPCTTNIRPLRNGQKKLIKFNPATVKSNKDFLKTLKDLNHKEELNYVRGLESWEQNTLYKKPNEKFTSRLGHFKASVISGSKPYS